MMIPSGGCDAMHMAAAVEAERSTYPEWISVKRQRPKAKQHVLFVDLLGTVKFATDCLDWDDGHVVFYVPAEDLWMLGDRWMPLPEAPKEEV